MMLRVLFVIFTAKKWLRRAAYLFAALKICVRLVCSVYKSIPDQHGRSVMNPASALLGTKETREFMMFCISMAIAAGTSLKDGKFEVGEVANFLPAMMEAPAAFEGMGSILEEMKDIDESELVELKAMVLEKAAHIEGIETKWINYVKGGFLIAQGLLVALKQ